MPASGLPRPGDRVGPYRLEDVIGRGGMGAVYRGRHEQTGALHAVKVVLADLVRDDAEFALGRFRREIETLCRLESHPGIVSVLASGLTRGVPWYSMELVEGKSLRDRLRDGPLAAAEAAGLLADVARAIAFAHAHGIVHRDLKPDNVLLSADGRPRVTDFGLAHDALADRLTRTGEMLGSPAYMAPEQVSPERFAAPDRPLVGPPTDVYGLGTLLYAALTGGPPFAANDARSVLVDVVTLEPTPPSQKNPAVPAELEAVCLRALAKRPEARFASASELADELERWLRGEQLSTRPSGRLQRRMRRYGPRRPASRFALASIGVAVAALVVAIAAWTLAPAGGATLRERLQRIERDLAEGRALSKTQRADLAAMADDPGAGDGSLAARVRAATLAARLAAPGEPDGAALAEAAALAERDPLFLDRLAPALCAARREDVLGTIVLALSASARRRVPAEVRASWARALAADTASGVPAPTEARDVELLHDAPGLRPDERAELLVRIGSRAIEREPPDHDLALSVLARALDEHDRRVDISDWPAFAEHCRESLVRLVRTDVDRAMSAAELLAGAGGELPNETVGRLRSDAATMLLESKIDPSNANAGAREAAIGVWALLQRFGHAPVANADLTSFAAVFGRDFIEARGERELGRPPAARNVSLLLTLARLLLELEVPDADGPPEGDATRASAWIDAVDECGLDERWLHLLAAEILRDLGRPAEALDRAERGLLLDRAEEDLERRWPLAPELVTELLFREGAEPGSPEHDRASALCLEAVRIQVAVGRRFEEYRAAGTTPPAACFRHFRLTGQIERVCAPLVAARRCCEDRGPISVPELVELGLQMAELEDGHTASLYATRARHAVAHDRLPLALADFDSAIAYKRAQLRSTVEPGWQRSIGRDLGGYHLERALTRRRNGETELALGDLDEAIGMLERALTGTTSPDPGASDSLGRALAARARIHGAAGRTDDATADRRRAAALLAEDRGPR